MRNFSIDSLDCNEQDEEQKDISEVHRKRQIVNKLNEMSELFKSNNYSHEEIK